jgi:hypothetical protein
MRKLLTGVSPCPCVASPGLVSSAGLSSLKETKPLCYQNKQRTEHYEAISIVSP